MFCSQCGHEAQGNFCSNCGHAFGSTLNPPSKSTPSTVSFHDESRDPLSSEQKRLQTHIDSATVTGTWDAPAVVVRPQMPSAYYKGQGLTADEEMSMLRAKRKEVEEQLRREGKLK